MSKALGNFLWQTALLVSGSFLFGFAIKALIVPQELLSSGLIRFALLVFYRWEGSRSG